jgi:hypothetical protein
VRLHTREAARVRGDERGIDPIARDEEARETVEEGALGPRTNREVLRRRGRRVRAERIDDHDLGPEAVPLDALPEDRVRDGEVDADEHDRVRHLEVPIRERRGLEAEALRVRRSRGLRARAVPDAEAELRQGAEERQLLGRERRREERGASGPRRSGPRGLRVKRWSRVVPGERTWCRAAFAPAAPSRVPARSGARASHPVGQATPRFTG